ncbi:MAG TPA: hypothetical protein VH081_10480 [Solirubrobacteraceae bacterium]|jgi:hypothetical protein|nr:hypothetical protein [Solirubrobacteraceae bacterium]
MSRYKSAINVSIVLLIAAAVFLLPGGGQAASTFEALLLIGFGVGFGYLGLRLYREYRVTLHGLGDAHRARLYGAIALAAFLIAAYDRMLHSTALVGVLWFVLLGLVLYALMDVYRHWRSY